MTASSSTLLSAARVRPWLANLILAIAFLTACAPAAPAAPTAAPVSTPVPAAKPTEAPKPAAPASTPVAAQSTPAGATAAASGPSSAAVDAKLAELFEAAKKDGELIWGIDRPVELYAPTLQAFQTRFPGIKVTTTTVDAPTAGDRLVTEAQAKRISIDVAIAPPLAILPLTQRDLVPTHDFGAAIDPNAISGDKRQVWVEDAVVGFVYNTRLVSEAEVPKKWEDLLGPKFKGKIASPKAGGGWDMLRGIWGEDQIVSFLKEVAKQDPTPTPAALDGLNRVATGDSYITNSTSLDLALNLKTQQGAPVAVAPLSPLYVNPLGLFTLKDVAHPAAAELFLYWMTTPEAKQAMQATGNWRFTPCGPQPIDQFVCAGQQDIFYIETAEKAAEGARLRQLFSQTLGFS